MDTFFESRIDKAAKGEGKAPPFFSCAQDTVELNPPLPLALLGYGKSLHFRVLLERSEKKKKKKHAESKVNGSTGSRSTHHVKRGNWQGRKLVK